MTNKNHNIQLPLYLQKFIIKQLCYHINKNNKIIDYFEPNLGYRGEDYRLNETEIKKLMMKLALVSKDWFKTLSNNLNVAVDFNYKDGGQDTSYCEWSIVKEENIKTLKLHYRHDNDQMYKILNGKSEEVTIDTVNEKLGKLSNLESNTFKKLIIRNVYTKPDAVGVKMLDLLGKFPAIENNLHIYEILLNGQTSLKTLENLENVKSLLSVIIDGCVNKQILLKTFKLWYSKLTKLQVKSTGETDFKLFELLTEGADNNKENYISNIYFLTYPDKKATLKDLVCIMKYAKNLTNFWTLLCYRNWLYFLSTSEEREKHNIKRCTCDSVVKRRGTEGLQQSEEDKQLEQQEFNENWVILKQLFKQNKTLKFLCFNYGCSQYGGFFGWDKNKPLPDSFVNEISSLIYSNTSIVRFVMLNTITTQIFQKIFENNTTILQFEASATNGTCNFDKCTQEFKALIEKANHIQKFKHIKHVYNSVKSEYDDVTLFEYSKEN